MAADVDYSAVADTKGTDAPRILGEARREDFSLNVAMVCWLGVATAIAFFNEQALSHIAIGDAPLLGLENGYLENVQLVTLLAAAGIYGYAGVKGRGAVRAAGALLALLLAAVLLREIDPERLQVMPRGLEWIETHAFQYSLYGVIGATTLAVAARHLRYFWDTLRLGLRWQAWPFMVAVALLIVAEFALDGGAERDGKFWEELIEANGYFFLAIAAWVHVRLLADPVHNRDK